jgi:phosphate transport system permease protein
LTRTDNFQRLTGAVGLLAPLVLVLIVFILGVQAWPSIVHFGPGFLVGRTWDQVRLDFAALPYIYGTVMTASLALLLAVPVGVGVALFLAEPSGAWIRSLIGTGVELLAAIPSVVYGLWALYVMGPYVYRAIELPVNERFGWLPAFAGTPRPTSLFAASLVLAVMVLPTMASVSRDVLKAVPGGLREASIALGATWWETTWRVVLPAARAGIFGATVLALGRALGETIAVTMIIGNRPDISIHVFEPAYTMAAVIANEFTEATAPLHTAALIELGLVLIGVTLIVNLVAVGILHRIGSREVRL